MPFGILISPPPPPLPLRLFTNSSDPHVLITVSHDHLISIRLGQLRLSPLTPHHWPVRSPSGQHAITAVRRSPLGGRHRPPPAHRHPTSLPARLTTSRRSGSRASPRRSLQPSEPDSRPVDAAVAIADVPASRLHCYAQSGSLGCHRGWTSARRLSVSFA